MKNAFTGILLGGLMAVGLSACSSTTARDDSGTMSGYSTAPATSTTSGNGASTTSPNNSITDNMNGSNSTSPGTVNPTSPTATAPTSPSAHTGR